MLIDIDIYTEFYGSNTVIDIDTIDRWKHPKMGGRRFITWSIESAWTFFDIPISIDYVVEVSLSPTIDIGILVGSYATYNMPSRYR